VSKPSWIDTTSHSRNETPEQRAEQTAAALRTESIEVSVHRHIDYDAQDWLVSTRPGVLAPTVIARGTDIEEAKRKAFAFVTRKLSRMLADLEKAQ
jgi:hypothetical protein